MPKVSVIVPVYNVERYLRECLDSILGQTLRDIEVICIDDGSTDGSAAILSEYAAKDGRVKVLSQSNQGQGVARNRGMETAKGEFVAFVDSDDLYPDADALLDLVAAAGKSGADVCGGSLEELLPNGAIRSSFAGTASAFAFQDEGQVDFREYAYDCGFYRFIYRQSLLRGNRISFPDYRSFEDPPFMVRALAAAGSFYAIARPVYRYRVELRPLGWRSDGFRKAKGLLAGIADVAGQAESLRLDKLKELALYQACEQYSAVLLDSGIAKVCADEVAALCRAFGVQGLDDLLKLQYRGRTSLCRRRAKLFFRRHFRCAFRACRFVADVVRYGLPYAAGRMKGRTE